MQVCKVVGKDRRQRLLSIPLTPSRSLQSECLGNRGLEIGEHLHPKLGPFSLLDPDAQDVRCRHPAARPRPDRPL
jgi:hypothetical protein